MKIKIDKEGLDYWEYLINPLNTTISKEDQGIIISPNQEEVNALFELNPQESPLIKKIDNFLEKLKIKDILYESKGKLIHDYYLMRECNDCIS